MGLYTEYFDCCAGYGYFEVAPLKPASTCRELLAEMDACGIARALVYHALQKDGSPQMGNRVLTEELADEARLAPTWTLLPPETGEFPGPHDLPRRMAEAGVRALRAFPKEHRYLLSGRSLDGLLGAISERRIPLLLQSAPWEMVEALLRDFPRLTLIACAHGPWGEDRYFRPLIERFPRLCVDTSRYEVNSGIAEFCRRYGPDRLLFGSGYPAVPPGGPRLALDGADIDDTARAAIAAGNLDRLLSEADLS